ncbi:YisB protein [Ophiocordyceps sinensis CO18]|uniref:YisB protein n=1 Tax=Ophiocordyceps sinensis (strain Co18 / CGMCC 3.14243) TaxID=911162 RepID=T5A831_OPHSC|nr:YisB protein [Ophiocordyceps sinensis CO18]
MSWRRPWTWFHPFSETFVAYRLVFPLDETDKRQKQQQRPLPPTTEAFLLPILTSYVETLTRPWGAAVVPPPDSALVHDKAAKRGWHREEDLQNVDWLCGACHRFVHHFRGHEDLARHYYAVELLLADDEVGRFAAWAGSLGWKGGRGGDS